VTLFTSVVLALSLAGAADRSALPPAAVLDVPYLSQTEALCGGAAVAMVLRYWGDRHADVQQFAPLVDRRAGGISTATLIEAVHQHHSRTLVLDGTVESLRDQLTRQRPVILLIQDRPGRLHYIVAVGVSEGELIFHDPTWGPSRRMPVAQLLRVWEPSRYWALVIVPNRPAGSPPQQDADQSLATTVNASATPCEVLQDEAVHEIGRRGLAAADEILSGARARCPKAAWPISELAGVRFAQRRFDEAAALASEAAHRDATNVYAWDVLGSTRFIQNDLPGALEAWNWIGKPRLDSLRIDGLERTRFALIAESLALTPNEILTGDRFRFAERRLQQLPNRQSARIGYRLDSDGFATVDIGFVERSSLPHGSMEWAAAGVHSLIDREASVSTPGWMGVGEVWSGSWRWWNRRPRVGMSFAAPRVGRFPGVVRIDAFHEVEAYRVASIGDEMTGTRSHGGIALSDWLSPDLRYEIDGGLDSWDGARRTASAGGAVERRFAADRIAVSVSGQTYSPLDGAGAFQVGGVHAHFRSKLESRGLVQQVSAGAEGVTAGAPLALWRGAGEGHARVPLLRAHRLLEEGVIDGRALGRRLMFVSAETERWLKPVSLARIGVAGFVDVAHTTRTLGVSDPPLQTDIGMGVRVRLPGRDGALRVDYGHGIRDGRNAVTIGWQIAEFLRVAP